MWLAQLLRRMAGRLDGRPEASDVLPELPTEFEPRLKNLPAIDPEARPVEAAGQGAPRGEDFLNLNIQEYVALRSEQRTRLDSANKIIHYSAIVLAALTAGLLTLYKDVGKDQSLLGGLLTFGDNAAKDQFENIFKNLLLLFPLISMPFALTQQNEEILVSRIGDYLDERRGRIAESLGDDEFWLWERWHNTHWSVALYVTAFFRSTLLIFFAALSLGLYYYQFRVPDNDLRKCLFGLDLFLLGCSTFAACYMVKERRRRAKSRRPHRRPAPPEEVTAVSAQLDE